MFHYTELTDHMIEQLAKEMRQGGRGEGVISYVTQGLHEVFNLSQVILSQSLVY